MAIDSDRPGGPGPLAADPDEEERLRRALQEAPRGALALASITVGLLILAWLAVYIFVFLPRGTVG